jgi:hypothetical protein
MVGVEGWIIAFKRRNPKWPLGVGCRGLGKN